MTISISNKDLTYLTKGHFHHLYFFSIFLSFSCFFFSFYFSFFFFFFVSSLRWPSPMAGRGRRTLARVASPTSSKVRLAYVRRGLLSPSAGLTRATLAQREQGLTSARATLALVCLGEGGPCPTLARHSDGRGGKKKKEK